MEIIVENNRTVKIFADEQTQNENDVTVLNLEVPEKYQDFNKKLVFILPHGEIVWDIVDEEDYKITRALSKYGQINFYVWLTKGDEDFRSETRELHFYPNQDATKVITKEEINGVNKVLKIVEEEIVKVENLEEELNNLIAEIQRKIEEGEFKGQDALINGYNTVTIEAGENIILDQEGNVLRLNSHDTTNYNELSNRPTINNVVLEGNKTLEDLGYVPYDDTEVKQNIANVSDRVTRTETRLDEKDGQVQTINNRLDGIDTQIEDLQTDLDNTETELREHITRVEGTAISAQALAEEAEVIAKGRATGYVFNSENDMYAWLEDEGHKAELQLGDNLYIVEKDVPDYWWDGHDVQELETQKVDLTGYVKNTNWATANKGGVFKTGNYLVVNTMTGIIRCNTIAFSSYRNADDDSFVGKGTLENVIIGKGLVSNTNYATANVGGVIKINLENNGFNINENGEIFPATVNTETYNNKGNGFIISKGTLENIKEKYIKEGLVNNTIQLTDEEQLAIENWLGLSNTYITMTNEAPYQVTGNYNPVHKKYVDEAIETALGTVETLLSEV